MDALAGDAREAVRVSLAAYRGTPIDGQLVTGVGVQSWWSP